MLDGVRICNSNSLQYLDNQRLEGTQQLGISTEMKCTHYIQCTCNTYNVLMYTGTLVHWYIGTLVDWYISTLVHWYTGTLVHWYVYGVLQEIQSRRIPTLNRNRPEHLKI